MIKKCRYKILHEYRLIIEYFSGDISENDIISLKDSVKIDHSFNIEYNILDVFTDADINPSKDGYNRILNWLKDNFSWERNSAVLTNTPDQVAKIMIFDSLQRKKLPMNIKIFSTLNAALYWVGLSEKDTSAIETVLEDLKS